MGIRRTAEKIPQNQAKKIQAQYSYHAPSTHTVAVDLAQRKNSAINHTSSIKDLFQYDVHLIFHDLLKTMCISIFIFILLLGINWFLKK